MSSPSFGKRPSQLVRRLPPLIPGLRMVLLDEGRADHRCHHLMLAPGTGAKARAAASRDVTAPLRAERVPGLPALWPAGGLKGRNPQVTELLGGQGQNRTGNRVVPTSAGRRWEVQRGVLRMVARGRIEPATALCRRRQVGGERFSAVFFGWWPGAESNRQPRCADVGRSAVRGSARCSSDGGQGQNRTADTRIFSPLLYQLSYLAIGEGGKAAYLSF